MAAKITPQRHGMPAMDLRFYIVFSRRLQVFSLFCMAQSCICPQIWTYHFLDLCSKARQPRTPATSVRA